MTTFESFREATGKQRPPGSHGCQPVEVVPGVWTAHFNDIQDLSALRQVSEQITTVVNCAPEKCSTRPGSYGEGVEVVTVDVLDDPAELKAVSELPEGPEKDAARVALPAFPPEECAGDAKKDFDAVIDVLEKTRLSGGASVVHCVSSLSRSTVFILAYIMKTQGVTAAEAVNIMQTKWSAVWPNDSFAQQLVEYEAELRRGKDE